MNRLTVFLFITLSIAFAVFAAFIFFYFFSGYTSKVDISIQRAKHNLIARKINATGLFIYDYNLITGKFAQEDNEVRQMGAMYLFGRLLNAGKLTQKDKELFKDSINKIFENTHTITKTKRKLLLLSYYDENKLGSLALLLNGALYLARHDHDWGREHKEQIKALLHSILWLQKENGDFAQFIKDNDSYEQKEEVSSSGYATGEALTVLATWLQDHPDDTAVAEAVNKAFDALDARGMDKQYKGLYLWLMTAANKIHSNKQLSNKLRKKAYEIALKYHMAMRNRLVFVMEAYNTCAHTEGLAQYILMARDKENIQGELSAYKISIYNNLRLQITPENKDYLMHLNAHILPHAYNSAYAQGAFLDSAKKAGTRIDYTQHCISAMLPFEEIAR